MATVCLSGSVGTDASDGLAYGVWALLYGSALSYLGDPAQGYGNGPTRANAAASALGSATPDDREVAISSDIETSYYKTEEGDSGAVQNQHDRNPDGSIAVDSVVAWQDESPGTERGWAVNNQPLTANPTNFNSPIFSWSLQGQGYVTYPTASTVDYSLVDANGGDFPLSTAFTVDVTDSDGAVGTNTYNITWHLPSENWALASTSTPVPLEVSPDNEPAPCGYNSSSSGEWSFTHASNGAGTALSDMFTIGAGLVDPPWAAFLAAAGLAFDDTQPKDNVTAVNFNEAWNDSYSSFNPPPADNSVATMREYQMKPVAWLQMQHFHYTADRYDHHGYAGPTSEDFDERVGEEFAGDFTLVSGNPPPPG